MSHLLNGNRTPQKVSALLDAEAEPPTEPGATDPESGEPVYTVIGEPVTPEETDATTIVLDLHPAVGSDQPDEEPEADRWRRDPAFRHVLAPLGWTLTGVVLVLVGVLVFKLVIPWLQTSATVTIVPVTKSASTTLTVHLVTSTPDPARQQVQGSQLPMLTLSQDQTVATTGSGIQPAQAAQGWITLYNALQESQTIPAGTLLIGQDGVQITTDTTVTIPAANLPTAGQVQVSAHASQPGPAGNIAALDINGPCCRADVLAKNVALFTGGQNERRYQAVSDEDIQGATTAPQTTLTQEVTTAYQADLQDGECLVTPVACRSQIQADHPEGAEAAHVTVTLSETCQGITYNTVQLQMLVSQALMKPTKGGQAGAYALEQTSLHIQIAPSSMHAGDVRVQASGTMVYQWNKQQQNILAALIAGKTKAQATALLMQQPGISRVAIQVAGRDTSALPSDSGRIQFVFVVYGQ